jgi:YHS domain-containing protein
MTLILAVLFACSTPAQPVGEPIVAVPEAPAVAMAFADDHGRLRCPVMGDVLESKESATSHADYKGVTYYFCCDACRDQFNADPDQYANGNYLRENGMWDDASVDAPGAAHEACDH